MWNNIKSELIELLIRLVLLVVSVAFFIGGMLWFEGKL